VSADAQAAGRGEPPPPEAGPWLTPGIRGIGLASLLSDLGHEIPTALLPSFLSSVLGAPAATLGLIEGVADALSGIAKLAGGALADDPGRRRGIAVGGYATTAVLSAGIGLATSALMVGLLRAGAWTARGLRVPARNALLADAVDSSAFGRAYGFERAMDNAGAVIGPLVALGLIAVIGIREAILVSVIPGLLAAVAIVYAVRHLARPTVRHVAPIRIVVRPLLRGRLGALLIAVALFEAGNVAATLLVLRATEALTPSAGDAAATIAIALYTGYNIAGTIASIPAGRLVDAHGARVVFGLGVGLFGAAYIVFAAAPGALLLALAFVIAGIGIGGVETAEHAAVASMAPEELRGSAFGLLALIQSGGDFVASALVGLLWTLVSPTAGFAFAAAAMGAALVALLVARRVGR
jgi:MFS family permease